MILATACSAKPAASLPAASPTVSRSCALQGYLVAAGADENNASLYDVDGCDGSARELQGIRRVSALGTGADTYAVSAAPVDVDQVFRLTKDDQLVPITGTQAPAGSAPAVSADGSRVAYIALGPPGPAPFTVVEVLPTGSSRVVYRTARPIGAVAYSPSGVLHVALNAPDPLPGQAASAGTAELLRVQRTATKLASLPFASVTGLAVSADSIAASGPETVHGLTFTSRGTVSGSFGPGLRVQAFSRDGRCLLVAAGRRFGCLQAHGSVASTPAWVPFGLDAVVVAARPR